MMKFIAKGTTTAELLATGFSGRGMFKMCGPPIDECPWLPDPDTGECVTPEYLETLKLMFRLTLNFNVSKLTYESGPNTDCFNIYFNDSISKLSHDWEFGGDYWELYSVSSSYAPIIAVGTGFSLLLLASILGGRRGKGP